MQWSTWIVYTVHRPKKRYGLISELIHHHHITPFITIQPNSWYSFYPSKEGRRLSWPAGWLVCHTEMVYLPADSQHPSIKRAWHRTTVISLIETNALPLRQFRQSTNILQKNAVCLHALHTATQRKNFGAKSEMLCEVISYNKQHHLIQVTTHSERPNQYLWGQLLSPITLPYWKSLFNTNGRHNKKQNK